MTEPFGQKIVDSVKTTYKLTEPFSQWLIVGRRKNMQSKALRRNDITPIARAVSGATTSEAYGPGGAPMNLAPVSVPASGLSNSAEISPALRAPSRETTPASPKTSGAAPTRRRKLTLIAAGAALALAAAGWLGYDYLAVGRFMVSTDDAYVRADTTTIAAKVAGYVGGVDVKDNTYVHSGDVIARIDDGDYRLAVDAARDKVATQQATVDRIDRQVLVQRATLDQAKAQLDSARALATRAQSELVRQQALAGKEFASRQALEQALANRDQSAAAVQGAIAAVDAAAAGIEVLNAQRQEAAQTLKELSTALAKAERDLSFTVIRAPVDGVVGNRAIQVGDYVQTGQRLASLVPLDHVYIDANFKETQLARLRPGMLVTVHVDALPDGDVAGTVASLSPASGSVFALLPPDNATGNFTKIVQRLAVRIQLSPAVTSQRLLRPGMSVVVSVNTKPHAESSADGSHLGDANVPRWQSARW
jgi:membrane fusion protein (multidrug efflux system)